MCTSKEIVELKRKKELYRCILVARMNLISSSQWSTKYKGQRIYVMSQCFRKGDMQFTFTESFEATYCNNWIEIVRIRPNSLSDQWMQKQSRPRIQFLIILPVLGGNWRFFQDAPDPVLTSLTSSLSFYDRTQILCRIGTEWSRMIWRFEDGFPQVMQWSTKL